MESTLPVDAILTPRERNQEIADELSKRHQWLMDDLELLTQQHMALSDAEKETEEGQLMADQGRVLSVYVQILHERIQFHTPEPLPSLIEGVDNELAVPGNQGIIQ